MEFEKGCDTAFTGGPKRDTFPFLLVIEEGPDELNEEDGVEAARGDGNVGGLEKLLGAFGSRKRCRTFHVFDADDGAISKRLILFPEES